MNADREGIKIPSVRIDIHQSMHQVEVRIQGNKVIWRSRIRNNRNGFLEFLDKIRNLQKNNSDSVIGIYVNPTGTYYVPLQYFLESHGYRLIYLDARITYSARTMSNLGKEKSDRVDAHMLTSTPWLPGNAKDKAPHMRYDTSHLTRVLESVKKNITRKSNILHADPSMRDSRVTRYKKLLNLISTVIS